MLCNLQPMERYEIVKDIGSGNFGVAKLVRDKWSGELYAIKYIERGQKVCSIYVYKSISVCIYLSSFIYEFLKFLSFNCLLLNWVSLDSEVFWVLQIDEHVQREIMNHRSLKHPNIIRFKEVVYLVWNFKYIMLSIESQSKKGFIDYI